MSLASKNSQPAQDGMPTTRGMNFFLEDRNLQFLCESVMGAETYARARPHLVDMGEVAGGELDELAAQADKNPPVLRAFFLHHEALIDQLLEHAAERLLGDVEDLQQVGDLHAGIAVDEMQHPVMGAAEGELAEHLVRVADEIAIGEKQQFDDVPDRLRGRRRRRGASHRALGKGGGLGVHIYVSHIDIFWFYVTKTPLRTKGSCPKALPRPHKPDPDRRSGGLAPLIPGVASRRKVLE